MSTEASLDKRAERIREMFAGVAPRYDLLNRLLSASLDRGWRRRAAGAVGDVAGEPVLDLCCGTGDQAIALARRGARVTAADFCVPMLAIARRKYGGLDGGAPRGLAGDALELPFPDASFAAAVVSFGLRNVADLDRALAEIRRVLRPGGRAAVLEFTVPTARITRALYLFYFRRLLPRIGSLLSPRGSAYSYLPASVLEFPQRDAFVARMAAAGLGNGAWRDLTAGIVALYTGRRTA